MYQHGCAAALFKSQFLVSGNVRVGAPQSVVMILQSNFQHSVPQPVLSLLHLF